MRIIWVSPVFMIRQFERGIFERLGKYVQFLDPGIHFQVPFFHTTRIRDIREHTMTIVPQHVITKDNVEIKVDGLIINQLAGCHLNSKCYDFLKNKIRSGLRIPTIGITFKRIGENIKQLKTKLEPFMELFM